MELENCALKHAIAAILAEIDPDCDRPELQAKIREAAEIAGLEEVSEVRRKKASPEASPSRPSAGEGSTSLRSAIRPRIPSSRPSKTIPESSSTVTIYRDPFHCHKCTEGAASILPFLGKGAFTFAGLIFWHLVEKHEARVHAKQTIPWYQQVPQRALEAGGTVTDPGTCETPPRLSDIIYQAPLVEDTNAAVWIEMAEARMQYYSKQSERFPTEDDSNDLVVSQDTSHDWLSPISAEQRIRSIVGDQVFAVLATPAIERWERKNRNRSYTRDENKVLVDGLLDRLSETFVCMGNGPHWDAKDFDSMFLEWCSPITGFQAQSGTVF